MNTHFLPSAPVHEVNIWDRIQSVDRGPQDALIGHEGHCADAAMPLDQLTFIRYKCPKCGALPVVQQVGSYEDSESFSPERLTSFTAAAIQGREYTHVYNFFCQECGVPGQLFFYDDMERGQGDRLLVGMLEQY
jgi:hypothetical protein